MVFPQKEWRKETPNSNETFFGVDEVHAEMTERIRRTRLSVQGDRSATDKWMS